MTIDSGQLLHRGRFGGAAAAPGAMPTALGRHVLALSEMESWGGRWGCVHTCRRKAVGRAPGVSWIRPTRWNNGVRMRGASEKPVGPVVAS
jgi:hypothetical protein